VKKTELTFPAIAPRQGSGAQVAVFRANAETIGRIARIERAGRGEGNQLRGFQRGQAAGHVRNIRTYLGSDDAILPNAIIVGFTGGARLTTNAGQSTLTVDVGEGAPGFIVDGQQRFTALHELNNPDFEVIVSAFICDSTTDLVRQFILINSVKPLPKSLVFELMRVVPELNGRVSTTVLGELIIETLNYDESSPLYRRINRFTNPEGKIKDAAIRKLVGNAVSDGFLRAYSRDAASAAEHGFRVFSEFFHAVADVFPKAWHGQTPSTSKLVSRIGIVAMGFVLEYLYEAKGARTRKQFAAGLKPLVGHTAWTEGYWRLAGEKRTWNSLQNVSRDDNNLAHYLIGIVKRASAPKKRVRG